VQLSQGGRTSKLKTAKSGLLTKGLKFGIIVSQFNDSVTKRLHSGALECLKAHGVPARNVKSFSCPGSFELPQVANHLAQKGDYDALICLGCIIRGETAHFEYIAAEAAQGIGQVARATGIPIAFGVLTTDTAKQALDRAGGKAGNKGWDAALSAIEMANLFRDIERTKRPER
jgi:6,7-dimethyl-8-ribityllumazine synthase